MKISLFLCFVSGPILFISDSSGGEEPAGLQTTALELKLILSLIFFLITFVGFSLGAGASPPLSSRRLREMKLGFVMETAVALYLLLSPAQVPALTSQNRENSCAAYTHTRQCKRQKRIFFVRRCLITFACCDSSQLHRLPLVRRNSHVITSYVLSISPNPNRFLCLTSFIYKTTELEISPRHVLYLNVFVLF